ncbi:MAG: hypothetical protein AAB853_02325 [Patescibacteria group bacterium]
MFDSRLPYVTIVRRVDDRLHVHEEPVKPTVEPRTVPSSPVRERPALREIQEFPLPSRSPETKERVGGIARRLHPAPLSFPFLLHRPAEAHQRVQPDEVWAKEGVCGSGDCG